MDQAIPTSEDFFHRLIIYLNHGHNNSP